MFYKVIICSHGFRSVTGVPVPVDINRVEPKLLSQLPGVGEKRAGRILRGRPFSDYKEFIRCLDDKEVGEKLKSFLFFGRGT
jgi:radical SAM superfamily enzyme with C-terminal helix-hairpin-helix motif